MSTIQGTKNTLQGLGNNANWVANSSATYNEQLMKTLQQYYNNNWASPLVPPTKPAVLKTWEELELQRLTTLDTQISRDYVGPTNTGTGWYINYPQGLNASAEEIKVHVDRWARVSGWQVDRVETGEPHKQVTVWISHRKDADDGQDE